MLKSNPLLVIAGTALGALAFAATAHSTTVETIYTPDMSLSGFGGAYAQVTITVLNPNAANIVFNSLTIDGVTYLMGGSGAADLNVNGPYTLGAVTETGLAGFSPTYVGNTPGPVDEFGDFNLIIVNPGDYGDAANSIGVQITNTSGQWTSDSAVLADNADGVNAAVDAFACTAPCTVGGGALATGFAANGGTVNGDPPDPPSDVPEPTTLAMLGTALAGAGLLRRRHTE
jgi:PEP-CTERM motif